MYEKTVLHFSSQTAYRRNYKKDLDKSLFSADLAPNIRDAAIERLSHELGGETQNMELVERTQRGDVRRIRYCINYPFDSVFLICQFNQENKITDFQTEW